MAKKEETIAKRIRIEGPKNPENGATILRFERDGRKKALDLYIGQILTVGEKGDITEEEASRLMSLGNWKVKEVENNG